ncbi:hypothetical protein F5146DRAFT_269613 [Armillaria mellea]|nr:hypothetical protein F5146DRAFT_269613 [Armillaria mellea]
MPSGFRKMLLMLDPYPQLPPELVYIVISELWYSESSSEDRVALMKTCPLINSLWMDIFAQITSRDIFVPTGRYLLYLSSIIRNNDSLIYHARLPHSTHTITCHVDLVEENKDATQEPYTTLSKMPNYIDFRKCFPNITKILPRNPVSCPGKMVPCNTLSTANHPDPNLHST